MNEFEYAECVNNSGMFEPENLPTLPTLEDEVELGQLK